MKVAVMIFAWLVGNQVDGMVLPYVEGVFKTERLDLEHIGKEVECAQVGGSLAGAWLVIGGEVVGERGAEAGHFGGELTSASGCHGAKGCERK